MIGLRPAIIGVAIATLIQSTCFAQNYHQQFERNDTSAGVFFRYSPSIRGSASENTTFGFGVYQSNSLNENNFADSRLASQSGVGMEYRLDAAHQGMWLRGHTPNGANEVRLNAQTRDAYGFGNSNGGSGNTLLIVAGVVVVVALAAALAKDSDPLMCSGNTIPNPISGRCEPLNL